MASTKPFRAPPPPRRLQRETIETGLELRAAVAEAVGLGRSKPHHQVTVPASFLTDIAALYYEQGRTDGLNVPVRATIKDVKRDANGDLAQVITYEGFAPRPTGSE